MDGYEERQGQIDSVRTITTLIHPIFFIQRRICTMPTPEGRKTLIDTLLKVWEREGNQELHVTSEGKLKRLLHQHFGLIVNYHLRF